MEFESIDNPLDGFIEEYDNLMRRAKEELTEDELEAFATYVDIPVEDFDEFLED